MGTIETARNGGRARAKALSKKELADAAKHAARTRWTRYYRENPDKLKARRMREKKRGKVRRGRPPKNKN